MPRDYGDDDEDRPRRRRRDSDDDDERPRRRQRDDEDDEVDDDRSRRRRRDDDDEDDFPRRRRRDDEDEDEIPRRRRVRRPPSGSVTGVAIFGIVLGALDLLFGLCVLMGVVGAGSEMGARGAFHVPGVGSSYAIALMIALLILAWGIFAIAGSIGVINRSQIGRIIIFVVAGIGGAYAIYCIVMSFMALSAPDPFQVAGGAKALAFTFLFGIGSVLISHSVWAFVALSLNADEFS